jgi:uncharacterized phage-associated protein
MNYNLTFEFNIEKLVQAIAFFSKSKLPDLTKLKVAKLLYFADKEHLLSHGKPIIGDVYWCMDFGPVPAFAMNEMSAAIGGSEVDPPAGESDASVFENVLHVKKGPFRKYPQFEVRDGKFDETVFTNSERSALRYVTNVYGHKKAAELVDLTHKEPTWVIPNQCRKAGSRALITYDLFFEGAPEKSRRFLGQLVADQYGVAIPLAGDADYVQFSSELADYSFVPDEIGESDVRQAQRYSQV